MEGLRSGGTDTAALLLLLGDPAYGAYRPRIYFSLWKFTGQESWRRKLAEEFPRSPEGRIAAGAGVTAEPSPVWLLFAAARPPQAPAPQEAPAAPAAPAPRRAGETLLQTGLFSREANARVLLEKLRGAGFSALTERRAGGNFIAVYVRPGPDINKSIRDLKAAGFDSFPVTP
jgi:hypothetical protein